MTIDNMKALMNDRDWELWSRAGDNSSFDFMKGEPGICCRVWPEKDRFEFIFVTQGMFRFSSGEMSPLDNKGHFDSRFSAFYMAARKLF